MIHISEGNSKMGAVPNISLPPGPAWGGRPDAPCFATCYANKAWRQYPQVRKAWTENWDAYQSNADDYFDQIYAVLKRSRTELFRWHVAGDIPDFQYLDGMIHIAVDLPKIRFLAHTKRFDLLLWVKRWTPSNLTIRQSMWPEWAPPGVRDDLPKTWMANALETRIPEDAYHCQGGCRLCQVCWNPKFDVYIDEH